MRVARRCWWPRCRLRVSSASHWMPALRRRVWPTSGPCTTPACRGRRSCSPVTPTWCPPAEQAGAVREVGPRAMRGHEGVAGPAFQRAGGHHVGVAGEHERRPRHAGVVHGPEVGHACGGGARIQGFAIKSRCLQRRQQQGPAARVVGCDGAAGDQGFRQPQRGGRARARAGANAQARARAHSLLSDHGGAAPRVSSGLTSMAISVKEAASASSFLGVMRDAGACSFCRRQSRLVGESA